MFPKWQNYLDTAPNIKLLRHVFVISMKQAMAYDFINIHINKENLSIGAKYLTEKTAKQNNGQAFKLETVKVKVKPKLINIY